MSENPKKKRNNTLKSIAEEIGVSPAVVTRTLRNIQSPVPISRETKQRILRIAVEKGIRTNNNIGVFLSENQVGLSEYTNAFITGIFLRAEKCSVNMKSVLYSEQENLQKNHEFLGSRDISGAIFLHEVPRIFKNFLTEEIIPYVTVNPLQVADSNCVIIDDYGAMRALLDEMEKQGYHKYLLILYDIKNNYSQQRIACFDNFLAEKKFPGKKFIIQNKIISTELEQEIKESKAKTVFITDARFMTIKILELFAVYGKKIPYDGGLVGNGFLDYNPDLTHLKYPYGRMGAAAVDMVCENWKNRNTPVKNIVLKGEVVIGKSTGLL